MMSRVFNSKRKEYDRLEKHINEMIEEEMNEERVCKGLKDPFYSPDESTLCTLAIFLNADYLCNS